MLRNCITIVYNEEAGLLYSKVLEYLQLAFGIFTLKINKKSVCFVYIYDMNAFDQSILY